jgi:hypothetical protein
VWHAFCHSFNDDMFFLVYCAGVHTWTASCAGYPARTRQRCEGPSSYIASPLGLGHQTPFAGTGHCPSWLRRALLVASLERVVGEWRRRRWSREGSSGGKQLPLRYHDVSLCRAVWLPIPHAVMQPRMFARAHGGGGGGGGEGECLGSIK